MNKKFYATLVCTMAMLLCSAQLLAVPALPLTKRVNVGGKECLVTLRGDEYLHYWQDESGLKIRETADGTFRTLSYFEEKNMRENADEARGMQNVRRMRRAHGFQQSLTGEKHGLVILVNFQDNTFSTEETAATYNEIFNTLNYTGYGMTGSVRDYYMAQSYGMFDLTLDVAGPYTLSKPMASYGGNDSNGQDIAVRAFAKESFQLADADVDYSQYDWDGDGVVEQVFIVYAGYAEAQGADANTIWPHSFYLSSPLKLDGVDVSQYACSSELRGNKGQEIDGIGTICHEFSHCLGLADHYDTQGGNFGMSMWDVMAGGSYNNNSCTPAAYTSFERWSMGWLTPVELHEQTDVKEMKPLVESPEAYVLYNDANPNEFYMLENRQLQGFDAALYGHGMLVLHVDYDEQTWETNMVNVSSARQRMTIIPADNACVESVKSLEGDPFPGAGNVTALTDYTTPAATLYNANSNGKKLLGKSIEAIREDANGLISFKVLYPKLATPEPTANVNEPGAFTLSWPEIPSAKTYELQLTEYAGKKSPAESLILEEDFEKTYKASAGFTDIGSKLSNYLSTQGFSGSALFQSPYKLRFGTGTTNGSLKSPTIDTLSTAQFTLVLKVKPYTEGTKVEGTLNVVTELSNGMNVPFEFTEEGYLLLHPSNNIETLFFFNIKPTSRMYLSYLALYDGEFTAEELGLEASAPARAKGRNHPVSTYTTSENKYVFQQLDPSARYEVSVRAIDVDRYSPWSEVCVVAFATGIGGVKAELPQANGAYYDLTGRKVMRPVPGNIYIRNGRKILY